jgi:hypothetical protein
MKTPKTVPLATLILEVIRLKSRRTMQAEIEQTISALEAYAQSLREPTKPKRHRRAA